MKKQLGIFLQVPCGQFIDDTTDLHDSAAMEIENVSPETNIPQVQTTRYWRNNVMYQCAYNFLYSGLVPVLIL